MADISDVEKALVSQIAGAVFSGAYSDGALAASVQTTQVRLYRGWPIAAQLDADLYAGAAHISIWPAPGSSRNTTRYPDRWLLPTLAAATLTTSATDTTATFAGTAASGQLAGILTDTNAYAYAVLAADTPTTISAALAALIPGASSVGGTVTIASGRVLAARVVQGATVLEEVGRREQMMRVILWCPSPSVRDALGGLVDANLAALRSLTIADGSAARIVYRNTYTDDAPQKADLWRRDLVYAVDYPITIAEADPAMLFGDLVITTETAQPAQSGSITVRV